MPVEMTSARGSAAGAEIIREATAEDIPALSTLFFEVFGQERPESVWRWKYFDNPRGTASFVCESQGRLVTHCGGTPVRFRDGEGEYLALQSVDFMSSPSHAGGIGGGGVFVRTVRGFFEAYCGERKVPLVYGFPGERHRLLGERLLGYRPVESVGELSLKPASISAESEPLDASVIRLVADDVPRMGVIRDHAYLEWRYLRHPLHRYGAVIVRRLWRPVSVAIVRETDEATYLMEIGGSRSRRSLQSLAEILKALGRPVIAWGSADHERGRALIDAGFDFALRDHRLECRFFNARPAPQPGDIYYTLGDYDVH